MKKRVVLALLAIAAVVGGIAAMRARTRTSQQPEVRTATVERGSVIATVTATGTLQALTTVDIKSKAGGAVNVLAVDVGTMVKAGQLIAKIDPTDTLMAMRTAQAGTEASQAKVEQARTNLSLQGLQNNAQLHQAEQGLRSARARLAQATKLAGAQPGLTRSSISGAKSALEAANQALRQSETATLPQTRASAQSAADDAKSNLAQAEENLSQLRTTTLPQERAQAQAASDQSGANSEVARTDLIRQKGLRSQGFIAQNVVDSAQNRYDLATAAAASTKEKMDTLQQEQASTVLSAEHRVSQARGPVASTQRRMQTLDAEMNSQLAAMRAKAAQAGATLQTARENAVQDSVKADDVTAARAAVKQAEATLASAKANALQLKVRAADIATARADVTSSAAKLQNANINYQSTVITAPRAGVILQKYVEQGTIITSGSSSIAQGTSIVQLGDISRMFVSVLVDEADIGSVEVGQAVNVTLDAYPSEIFDGKVTRVDPLATTTQNVTTINVTVEVDNPDARLKPGMNGSCEFVVDRADGALYVPSEAVKEDDDGTTTITVLRGGKQIRRTVETGIASGDSVEIKSGVKEGETVVTAIIEATGNRAAKSPTAGGAGGAMRGMPGAGGAMGGMPRGR